MTEQDTEVGQARVPNRWGEGQRLRQEILDAAQRLLEATGHPDEISLRAIAREVGVTASAVYKHFEDKADLLWTLLDTAYAGLADRLLAAHRDALPLGAWAGVRAAVDVYCRLADEQPRRYDLMFRIAPTLPPRRDPLEVPSKQVLDAWRDVIIPQFPDDPEAAGRTAKLLWTGLHGQIELWRNVSADVHDAELSMLRNALLTALFGRC